MLRRFFGSERTKSVRVAYENHNQRSLLRVFARAAASSLSQGAHAHVVRAEDDSYRLHTSVTQSDAVGEDAHVGVSVVDAADIRALLKEELIEQVPASSPVGSGSVHEEWAFSLTKKGRAYVNGGLGKVRRATFRTVCETCGLPVQVVRHSVKVRSGVIKAAVVAQAYCARLGRCASPSPDAELLSPDRS